MASSLVVVSSFSLQRRHQTPLPPLNLSPFPLPILQTLQCRKSINLTPNFQTQTRTLNPPPPATAPVATFPESGRSNFIYQFEKSGEFTSIEDFNDALVSLLVANEPESALKLLENLPRLNLSPNGWTYSIIVRCHCKRDDPFEAKKVLDLMIASGFNPNVITFTALIDAFCKRGRVQRALEVFQVMKKRKCEPNVQTFNCLLKGMCFVGKVEEASAMVVRMKEDANLPDPDVYSYTAVMDGLCKVGRSDEAMELLVEAIGMGLKPTVVTYNSLFTGYCKEGRPKKGFKLLKVMKERNCEPDYITYSSLLHGLLKWGFIGEAFGVYSGMLGLGMKVDERMMNTLLRALCRRSWKEEEVLKHAYNVYDRMRSWDYEVYSNTQQLVIQTLCVGNKIDEALASLKGVIRSGDHPRMMIINRIVRGLCEEGRLNEAVSVLVLVYEIRRIPSKISFNILINEFSKRGELMGASFVYGFALKIGVRGIDGCKFCLWIRVEDWCDSALEAWACSIAQMKEVHFCNRGDLKCSVELKFTVNLHTREKVIRTWVCFCLVLHWFRVNVAVVALHICF